MVRLFNISCVCRQAVQLAGSVPAVDRFTLILAKNVATGLHTYISSLSAPAGVPPPLPQIRCHCLARGEPDTLTLTLTPHHNLRPLQSNLQATLLNHGCTPLPLPSTPKSCTCQVGNSAQPPPHCCCCCCCCVVLQPSMTKCCQWPTPQAPAGCSVCVCLPGSRRTCKQNQVHE